jgi:formylglycine-generating enzyme required for sulfatase activity
MKRVELRMSVLVVGILGLIVSGCATVQPATEGSLYTQQPVVAVAPFDAISGIDATEANMITRVFFIRLGNTNKVSGYRLPTEAEWEWAAKGGRKDFMVYEYSGSNGVDGVGSYKGNRGSRTHAVKTTRANSLGLYDMSGNVWEWCWDWYGSYSSGTQTDPAGVAGGSSRVLRGGLWLDSVQYVRSAYRYCGNPSSRVAYFGFRLVRP